MIYGPPIHRPRLLILPCVVHKDLSGTTELIQAPTYARVQTSTKVEERQTRSTMERAQQLKAMTTVQTTRIGHSNIRLWRNSYLNKSTVATVRFDSSKKIIVKRYSRSY